MYTYHSLQEVQAWAYCQKEPFLESDQWLYDNFQLYRIKYIYISEAATARYYFQHGSEIKTQVIKCMSLYM